MKDLLIERLGCTEKDAARIAGELEKLPPELMEHINGWTADASYTSDVMYEGYSLNSLMQDYGMQFTGALLTLGWLLRSPEEAKKALRFKIR